MAVCVEETSGGQGCQISIAINKRTRASGGEVLNKVQRGFQQIFGRLRNISSDTKVAIEEAVFNDIIALCREKILGRLRSKKSKTSYKSHRRFAGLVLQDFIGSPWQDRLDKSSPQMTTSHVQEYQRRLETLRKELDKIEAADVIKHEDLLKLVEHIAQFMEVVPLAMLLGVLKKQDMNPDAKDRLLNCLSKIARYRECARFLCRRAQNMPMLRNVNVQQVQIAARSEGGPLPPETAVDLEQSLSRFQYGGLPVQISALPEWLRKIAVSSQESFPERVRDILKNSKVHAEVQLMVHYNHVSDGVVPPRILAASKDACSLCHSLIKLHGRFDVPKSHGKLYSSWCLPAAYQESPLQRSLNVFLEKQISATLERLMTLPKRPILMCSNESSIFPISVSASTLANPSSSLISNDLRSGVPALARPSEDDATGSKVDQKSNETESIKNFHVEDTEPHNVGDGADDKRDVAADASVDGSASESTHDARNGVANVDQVKTTDEASFASNDIANDTGSDDAEASIDGSVASVSQTLSDETLRPGQTIAVEPVPGSTSYFRTNRLNMSIDDSSGRFSFRWLSEPEAEAVLRANTNAVLDIKMISPGVDVTLTKDAKGHTYFSYGGEVIMIRALETQDSSIAHT
ncbi:hypothetical protein VM1G_02084 [Cytospora mali]|uniref:Uncharacterized protein n=1 Tax=Cytospora mali TaxID=578113 RepID=A0A194VP09_CYTMA|nr:hypothetical protein VM1G_02084 [Valsa mali]